MIKKDYNTASGGLGKNIWGPGPSSFGRQQRLNEVTIEPIKNLGAWASPPGTNLNLPLNTAVFIPPRRRPRSTTALNYASAVINARA